MFSQTEILSHRQDAAKFKFQINSALLQLANTPPGCLCNQTFSIISSTEIGGRMLPSLEFPLPFVGLKGDE